MEALSCAFDSSCMSILESSCSAGCTSDLEPARLGGICDNRPAGRSLHDCLVNNEDSYSDEPTCEEWESESGTPAAAKSWIYPKLQYC
jgi:hypothetical protein